MCWADVVRKPKSANMNNKFLDELLEKARAHDPMSLGRLLTLVERETELVLPWLLRQKARSPAARFGITGPPGAGKSSLIGKLLKSLRDKGCSVAVIAVDPSSPFSNGAILGDRIRYSEFVDDQDVFVRSLGTRGNLGGISISVYPMLRLLDLCNFDVVIVETVGVGQTELEVMNVVDQVIVVLVPESGDSIQAMKAGLLEIADLFLVNKADRPGADVLVREIESAQQLGALDPSTEKDFLVLKTNGLDGTGIEKLLAWILERRDSMDLKLMRNDSSALQAEARALLRIRFELKVLRQAKNVKSPSDLMELIVQRRSN